MPPYSLTGMSSLGTVTKETNDKDSGLFEMALPSSDSSSKILLDLFGASRTISISGTYIGADLTAVQTFITQLDALINGNQTQKTFVSEKSGASYLVLITSTNWEGEEGAPLKVNYTINMSEGST